MNRHRTVGLLGLLPALVLASCGEVGSAIGLARSLDSAYGKSGVKSSVFFGSINSSRVLRVRLEGSGFAHLADSTASRTAREVAQFTVSHLPPNSPYDSLTITLAGSDGGSSSEHTSSFSPASVRAAP